MERWPITKVQPYPKNARSHSKEQIALIAQSIQRFGFTAPVLVDEDGVLIYGHGRVAAAKLLGFSEVPVCVAVGWPEKDKKAYRIADNQIALRSDWDMGMLKAEVQELKYEEFELKLLGFPEQQLQWFEGGELGTDPEKEWTGVPGFSMPGTEKSFRQIIVHFKDQAAVDQFEKTIGRSIAKARYIHFPDEPEIKHWRDKLWVGDDGTFLATAPSSPAAEPVPYAAQFRYGEVLPKDFIIPAGVKWILGKDLEKNPFKHVLFKAGDRVMDVGGCVGTFSAAALEQGASALRVYEPMPKNAEIIRKNLDRYGGKAEVIEGAVIADNAPQVEIFGTGFPGNDSVVPDEKRKKSMIVRAVNFRGELAQFQPQVVKLDIEGGEYELLQSLEPGDLESVTCFFIEFHPHEGRNEIIEDFKLFLESEGFVVANDRLRAFTAIRAA